MLAPPFVPGLTSLVMGIKAKVEGRDKKSTDMNRAGASWIRCHCYLTLLSFCVASRKGLCR